MIAIVSPALQERAAFAALCESRGWVCAECHSLRAFRRLLLRQRPEIVLTRRRIGDGYSDDVIAAVAGPGQPAAVKVVVLMGADAPSSVEARQVALGADCVLRDPVCTDVLVEYLAKYHRSLKQSPRAESGTVPKSFSFADACVDPIGRQLQRGKGSRHLTPHEVDLVELLVMSAGGIVTYDTLYNEILGRRFRGDTSNMRVLLGKLAASARGVGLPLRQWVEVIPKMGYRYHPVRSDAPPSTSRALLSAAK